MSKDKKYRIMKPLYDVYSNYKTLCDYYYDSVDTKKICEIMDRLEYLKDNPDIKQKSEIECLLWVIGDKIDEE